MTCDQFIDAIKKRSSDKKSEAEKMVARIKSIHDAAKVAQYGLTSALMDLPPVMRGALQPIQASVSTLGAIAEPLNLFLWQVNRLTPLDIAGQYWCDADSNPNIERVFRDNWDKPEISAYQKTA